MRSITHARFGISGYVMLSTSGRSLLRPQVESIISAIQGPQEKVVFVRLFPYYCIPTSIIINFQKKKMASSRLMISWVEHMLVLTSHFELS